MPETSDLRVFSPDVDDFGYHDPHETRYQRLFGTPERAAKSVKHIITHARRCHMGCKSC